MRFDQDAQLPAVGVEPSACQFFQVQHLSVRGPASAVYYRHYSYSTTTTNTSTQKLLAYILRELSAEEPEKEE